MTIWHVGACTSPLVVNGVNALIYTLAEEQLRRGHAVSLLLPGDPDEDALTFSRQTGANLVVVPKSPWQYERTILRLLNESRPDIVHMHSVFIPHQAQLARLLRKMKIPYVVTPNGGFAPQILRRSRLKKMIYSLLIEKRRIRGAALVSAVTPGEEDEIRSFSPHFRGDISCIPNAINPETLKDVRWLPTSYKPCLVFLGRLDVEHKGIDILAELGRYLPEAELHLFGATDSRSSSALTTLMSNCPPNMFFHKAVFGSEKALVLSGATLYIQASRWEAFGISIAEAMYIGVPCAIANTLHMARSFEQHDLGLVFEPDAARGSAAIRSALQDNQRLAQWSARARVFAQQNFHPEKVTSEIMASYATAIAHVR